MHTWTRTFHTAAHWQSLENQLTRCHLCPRNCVRKPGQTGFCGVRQNLDGRFVSLNYGKSVPMTQETIETEAVFHYAPGEPILSLGNVGCMMRCDFCQNWTTSQAEFVRDKDVALYTPEQVVEYALRHNIRVLSWTYNDPVVWHEFVMETGRLGRAHGLKNLYKSAFYISEKAIAELLEVMDIFSISVKSMDSDFYRSVTKGEIEPVLQGILQVYAARKQGVGPHLEISNLCVTGRNDSLAESLKVARWMLENLDAEIPLHYVRFHPDFLYTHAQRTSIPFLEEARLAAINEGMRYVYVGNVHGTPSANTYCPECGTIIVARYGLTAKCQLGQNGTCIQCGAGIPLILPWRGAARQAANTVPSGMATVVHRFRGPIQSCHIEQDTESPVYYQFEDASGRALYPPAVFSCLRFMLSSSEGKAAGVRLYHEPGKEPRLFEVYDRAHFPILQAEKTCGSDINVPPPAVDLSAKSTGAQGREEACP